MQLLLALEEVKVEKVAKVAKVAEVAEAGGTRITLTASLILKKTIKPLLKTVIFSEKSNSQRTRARMERPVRLSLGVCSSILQKRTNTRLSSRMTLILRLAKSSRLGEVEAKAVLDVLRLTMRTLQSLTKSSASMTWTGLLSYSAAPQQQRKILLFLSEKGLRSGKNMKMNQERVHDAK